MVKVISIIYICCSVTSALISGIIVLSGLLFPSMFFDSTRPISHIIICISLADFMASIGNSLGFHSNDSAICQMQAVFYNYFLPCSWIWTTILVYQLSCLITTKRMWLKYREMHIIGWGLGLIPAILPLTTNTYGNDDVFSGEAPCNYAGDRETKLIWLYAVFLGLPLICFLLMIWWLLRIKQYLKSSNAANTCREYSLFNVTKLYPVALIATWLPIMTVACFMEFGRQSAALDHLNFAFLCLTTQYGTSVGLLFMFQSASLRRKWYQLFFGLPVQYSVDRSVSTCTGTSSTNQLRQSLQQALHSNSSGIDSGSNGLGGGDIGGGGECYYDSDEESIVKKERELVKEKAEDIAL